MAFASLRRSWPKRAVPVGIVLLLITGLLGALEEIAPAKDPPKLPPKPKDASPTSETTKPVTQAKGQADALPGNVADVVKLIDDKLEAAWKANKIKPADRCSDYEYIRRVTLDLIGRIAKPSEIDRFLKDPEKTRRAQLVDRLLNSEDYARNWANQWCIWLLTRAGEFGRGRYHDEMHVWLEEQFDRNTSYKDLVTGLIAPKQPPDAKTKPNANEVRRIDSAENGAVNFILAHVGDAIPGARQREEGQHDMTPITSRTTRLFLGIQTQCTQCHDHPFDTRKQSEFWGINAFFRQVQRLGNPPKRRNQEAPTLTLVERRDVNPERSVFFEKRSGFIVQQPATFLDGNRLANQASSRLDELAHCIVGHENFAKAYVNRMWGHFFGKGFVNPVDDFNSQNTVNHPELLAELGAKFQEYGYDQKLFIRWVCSSRAYNLKSTTNPTNDKPETDIFFSHMLLKAMSPEQLFESIMVATEAETALTAEAKADLRQKWMNQLIANFGDDEGNEVNFNGTVVQALLLMNGADINKAIADPKGMVLRHMTRGYTAGSMIHRLYLAALNRPPTAAESQKVIAAMPLMKPAHDKREGPWVDLLWALINSNEFMLNH
jgi:hypothetical protein